MQQLDWHQELENVLGVEYGYQDETHGGRHARAVENMAIHIIEDGGFGVRVNERAVRAAALLHDLGHTQASESWSNGHVEHIRESLIISRRILEKIPLFKDDPVLLEIVCYLILRHDDTNFSFPILRNGGSTLSRPQEYENFVNWDRLSLVDPLDLDLMASIVREADSLMGTGQEGAERTWKYSRRRAISPIAAGSPLNAFAWEESASGNVRLAAKRALLDSRSQKGRALALKGFRQTERFLAEFCSRNSVVYQPEPSLVHLDSTAFDAPTEASCVVERYETWDALVDLLRRVPLKGDSSLYPYAAATIESRLVRLDSFSPSSFYVLAKKVRFQEMIHQRLLKNYMFDIFNLSGIIEFKLDGLPDPVRLAPPIIERYRESTGELLGNVSALVDGLHRCYAAKKLGLTSIRVVFITKVPRRFPLVPLPLNWSDVKMGDQVPSVKRRFRFKSAEDVRNFASMFPKVYSLKSFPDDLEDPAYYFYRVLSEIGSDGPRPENGTA